MAKGAAPNPATLVWRSSDWRALASGALAAAMLGLGGLLAALAIGLGLSSDLDISLRLLALVLALMAVFVLALVPYLWRNAQGFWRGWVCADAETIRYCLPANRSLVHRPPAVRGEHPWQLIDRLEVRLEAYRTTLMAMMQRTCWLVTRSGERVLLFEDRGLGTPHAVNHGEAALARLAALGQVPVLEVPMVEGKGGLFGAWFTAPPSPDARPLAAPARKQMARRLRWTGYVLAGSLSLVLLVRALAMLD